MRTLDRTLPELDANLALDEALLLGAEAGGPEVLRFWEWSEYAVVLGAGGKLEDDVRVAACEADGVPIARRSSGGGTVLLGPGCLCFSLVLHYDRDPALRDVNASYRWILDRVAGSLGPTVGRAGISDLAIDGRKFSGNAQHRKQRSLLHHGTVLYDFDLDRIDGYLRMPDRKPEYRGDRGHWEFVRNLEMDGGRVKSRVTREWAAVEPLRTWPEGRAAELVREKYGRDDWVRRR